MYRLIKKQILETQSRQDKYRLMKPQRLTVDNKNDKLCEIVKKAIAHSPHQRITFADYMELVLYHPKEGYYTTNRVNIGKQGDFFTSPNLGADFGELLAEQFAEIWHVLENPSPFNLVEMGAGLGLLADDILNYLEKHHPDCFQVLEYGIIEKAAGLIDTQKQTLKDRTNLENKLRWCSWEDITDNSLQGCLFSNELVDAFPVHRVTKQNGRLQEIYVTIDSTDNFVEVVGELSTPKLVDYLELVEIDLTEDSYPDGYQTEVNLASLDWIKSLASKLRRGYVLTVDYGYQAGRYYSSQRGSGTLQCYYQHQRHDNPYANVGHQDITAHVDFTNLERRGELQGLEKLGFAQQGLFLMALGLGDRLAELSSGKLGIEQLIQRRDTLHQLIDPAGLGNFGVFVQSKGLTEEEKKRSLQGLKIP